MQKECQLLKLRNTGENVIIYVENVKLLS